MKNMSDQINELSTALSKAQGQMPDAVKGSTNPHYKHKYATLESIWNACRETLSNHGLAIIQAVDDTNGMHLVTTLTHSSGQWICSRMPLLLGEKVSMQSVGAAITYARRYSISSMIGIVADEDDDAESCEAPRVIKTQKPFNPPEVTKKQLEPQLPKENPKKEEISYPVPTEQEVLEIEEFLKTQPTLSATVMKILKDREITIAQLPRDWYERLMELKEKAKQTVAA